MLSDRRGFTLIELMVVVSIIGLLASIAIPRYSTLKQRAYVATMKSDLHNLVAAQEAFYVGSDDYAGGVASGAERPGKRGRGRLSFSFSPGVKLVRLRYRHNRRRGVGWNAVVRHANVKDRTTDRCGIFIGNDRYSPNRAVTSAGAPACW